MFTKINNEVYKLIVCQHHIAMEFTSISK